jgi:hypothetical protein
VPGFGRPDIQLHFESGRLDAANFDHEVARPARLLGLRFSGARQKVAIDPGRVRASDSPGRSRSMKRCLASGLRPPSPGLHSERRFHRHTIRSAISSSLRRCESSQRRAHIALPPRYSGRADIARRRKRGTHYLSSDPGRTAPSIWPGVIYGRHRSETEFRIDVNPLWLRLGPGGFALCDR